MSPKNHIILRVEGMTCDGCARHVTEALKKVPGVDQAQVASWKSGQAVVVAAPEVDEANLIAAVKQSGYRAVQCCGRRVLLKANAGFPQPEVRNTT